MTDHLVDTAFAGEFLRRLHGAVNAHDPDAIAELCAENVIWDDPAAPRQLCGRKAVRRFHQENMFPALPDVQVELIDGPYLSAKGDGFAVRLRISGTMMGPLTPPGFAPTRGRLSFETAEFSTIRDGLLSRHTVVLNMLDLARQIGAVPEAGSFGAQVGLWMQHVSAFWERAKRLDRNGVAQ